MFVEGQLYIGSRIYFDEVCTFISLSGCREFKFKNVIFTFESLNCRSWKLPQFTSDVPHDSLSMKIV